MSITINWSLNENPCGVYVEANLRIDEYDSSHVFVATRVNETFDSFGSFSVDTGHWLKATAFSYNSPSFAWPQPDCGLVVHIDSNPTNEAIITRTCGDTVETEWLVGGTSDVSIYAYSFILGYSSALTFVYIAHSYLINFTTAYVKFTTNVLVNTTVSITFRYKISGGSWVENQPASITSGSDQSTPFEINGVTIADDIDIEITAISPTYYSLYVYRPLP